MGGERLLRPGLAGGARFAAASSHILNSQTKAQELSNPVDSYLVPFNNHKGLPEKQKEKSNE